jgi:hypothetical protein
VERAGKYGNLDEIRGARLNRYGGGMATLMTSFAICFLEATEFIF